MTEVMRTLRLAQLENDLADVNQEIKRLEGIIRSPNVKSESFKRTCKKQLKTKAEKQRVLFDTIAEAMLLGADIL